MPMPRLPKVFRRPSRPNFLPTRMMPKALVWLTPMPRASFEFGSSTPNLKPSAGPRRVSLRSLILVARRKSPVSLVELAPAATSSGIAPGVRVLMLRKFCATPSIENSTLGESPTWTPMTPTRVKSPVSPDAGNFASCTKSIPTCTRKEPGWSTSTSSVRSGRCCACAAAESVSANASANKARTNCVRRDFMFARLDPGESFNKREDCNGQPHDRQPKRSPGFCVDKQVRTTRGSGWAAATRRYQLTTNHPLPRAVLTRFNQDGDQTASHRWRVAHDHEHARGALALQLGADSQLLCRVCGGG